MARIGYARLSTTDQDFDIQNERLKTAGSEFIRSETGSGASRKGRSELETIMQFCTRATNWWFCGLIGSSFHTRRSQSRLRA